MANPESKYRRLQELQNMGTSQHKVHVEKKETTTTKKSSDKSSKTASLPPTKVDEDKVDSETEKKIASKARLLAKDDVGWAIVCVWT